MSKSTPPSPEYRTKTIKRGNFTIIVHRPVLDEKEQRKREGIVLTALTHFGKSLEQQKQNKKYSEVKL